MLDPPMHPVITRTSTRPANATIVGASRVSKRSLSSSNDLIYERDRFRARLQSLNPKKNYNVEESPSPSTSSNMTESTSATTSALCEVCDDIGYKTTKLNIAPDELGLQLSPSSGFFSRLLDVKCVKIHPQMVAKAISYPQLAAVFGRYFNSTLPETKHMFPWLHGLHEDNFAQRLYFVYQQQQQRKQGLEPEIGLGEKPQDARFLMCINSSSHSESQPILKNSVSGVEVLQRIDISRLETAQLIKSVVLQIFSGEEEEELASVIDTVTEDCFELQHIPLFLNLDPDRGISLRNFHIQVAKLALCSDFVVYCFDEGHGKTCRCARLARVLWISQRFDTLSTAGGLDMNAYNVFITGLETSVDRTDDALFTVKPDNALFSSIESNKKTQLTLSNLRNFTSNTLSIWDNDYSIKEKVETTRMSSATQICKNVWVGNIWDYQIMMHYLRLNDHELDLDVRIEPLKSTKDRYCDPSNSIITQENDGDISASNILSILSPPRANWRLFLHCHNDASFPELGLLALLLFKYTISGHNSSENPEYHVLDFPPSGSIGIGDCKKDNLLCIVNTCKLLYLYLSSSKNTEDTLSSLIYCSDGYTELSLLVLCYTMYAQNLTLDEAMLRLHLTYGRPFYIFSSDVAILRKLQVILMKFSPAHYTPKWLEVETLSDLEFNDILLGPKFGARPIADRLKLGYIASDSDSDSLDESDDDFKTGHFDSYLQADWVKDVEGSIPSRVLPYLYLGLLKHASSLTLLLKLGINKIISVGETLDWLNGYKFQENYDITVDELDHGNIEMFNISPNEQRPSLKRTSVDTVLKVNNLQDDGIDELSSSLPRILEYINDVYKQSEGQAKILVHCRVGVSRLATVVIAEVMRRLHLLLPKAYLFVRVRRLNIIIQPNLRFMYELFKWEEKQKQLKKGDETLREIDWFVMCREIMRLNIPYLGN